VPFATVGAPGCVPLQPAPWAALLKNIFTRAKPTEFPVGGRPQADPDPPAPVGQPRAAVFRPLPL